MKQCQKGVLVSYMAFLFVADCFFAFESLRAVISSMDFCYIFARGYMSFLHVPICLAGVAECFS
jgi:hypothetical protein